MLSDERFHMRISPEDRAMLKILAKHFQRSQADTIKTLVRGAYELVADKSDDEKKLNQEHPVSV